MPSPIERRRAPRADLDADVTLEVPGEVLQLRALDVGTGGMALRGDRPAPRGFVRLGFRLGPQASHFDIHAMVVRETTTDGGEIWGLRFHDLDPGTQTRLLHFVKSQRRVRASA